MNWDDVKLFRLVVEAGSLLGASEKTGVSPATLGRKVQRLENNLGAALFEKTQSGYVVTTFGKQLFERTHSMALTIDELSIWRDQVLELPLITISTIPEVQWLLTQEIRNLWSPQENYRIAFEELMPAKKLENNKSVLLVTPTKPQVGNLKVLSLGNLSLHTYCAPTFDQENDCNWVGLRSSSRDAINPPRDMLDDGAWVTVWASSFDGLVTMVEKRAGRAILPQFVGGESGKLILADQDIKPSSVELFLVSHGDQPDAIEMSIAKDKLTVVIVNALKVPCTSV